LVSPLGLTIPATETISLGQGFGNLTSLGPLVDPVCATAAINSACALVYPQCQANSSGTI